MRVAALYRPTLVAHDLVNQRVIDARGCQYRPQVMTQAVKGEPFISLKASIGSHAQEIIANNLTWNLPALVDECGEQESLAGRCLDRAVLVPVAGA